MIKYVTFFFLILITENIHADNQKKLCSIDVLKNINELKEKIKICNIGEKIIIKYSQSIDSELIIAQTCNLKFNIIFEREKTILNQRDPFNKILCIFLPAAN